MSTSEQQFCESAARLQQRRLAPSLFGLVAACTLLFALCPPIHAQLRLPTTIELLRPLPSGSYADKREISLYIEGRMYHFLLLDIYTDDPAEIFMGEDVWRYINTSKPNMYIRSGPEDKVKNMEPGETLTVHGLFSFASRTMEISSVEAGSGIWVGPKHY